MNSEFDLSIVISSYNRDGKIGQTLERLFESDLNGLRTIELIVIDDGSPESVRDVIAELGPIPEKFEFRLIEQKNSGIGATRNRGFREARAGLVLFLDDDILVKRDTIRSFIDAHRKHPGGVIFGSYPFITHETHAMAAFARTLYGYDEIVEDECFTKVDAITSGLLAVDKAKLNGMDNFYEDDMTIPAAEEHEIISRFHKLGIPIYHARHISAIHNHHLQLEWLVSQQYKYGLATAEAFAKHPEIADIEKFSELERKLKALRLAGVKSALKLALATRVGRKLTYLTARLAERFFPDREYNFLLGLTTTSYFWGGYLDGRNRFEHPKGKDEVANNDTVAG